MLETLIRGAFHPAIVGLGAGVYFLSQNRHPIKSGISTEAMYSTFSMDAVRFNLSWEGLNYNLRFLGRASLYVLGIGAYALTYFSLPDLMPECATGLGNFGLWDGFKGVLSGPVNNIFSANIVGAAIGVANAYYLNYELWDQVEKEVGKDATEYNQGLRDKLATAYKTKADKAENKDKQAIKDELAVKQQALEKRITYANEKRQFFKDYPYILPCLKYATAGSLGILSLFVESKAYNPLFAVMPAVSYLATSAITHYITSQPGEPLVIKMVAVPGRVAKQVFEIGSGLVKDGADYASSFIK